MGALFLASKLEESTLRIRDIVNCFSYLSSLISYCSTAPYPPPNSYEAYVPMDYFATEFYDHKDALVIAEMQLLKRLGFQTQCGLPYGHLVNYLQCLELTGEKELVNRCWGFCNDMCAQTFSLYLARALDIRADLHQRIPASSRLQTPAPALYPQGTLALASIYLAIRLPRPAALSSSSASENGTDGPPPPPTLIALPLEPVPWWTHFDATEEELVHITSLLLSLYRDWGGSRSGVIADGGVNVKEEGCVWRRAGGLPVTKSGVREALARIGADDELGGSR